MEDFLKNILALIASLIFVFWYKRKIKKAYSKGEKKRTISNIVDNTSLIKAKCPVCGNIVPGVLQKKWSTELSMYGILKSGVSIFITLLLTDLIGIENIYLRIGYIFILFTIFDVTLSGQTKNISRKIPHK